MTASVLVAVAIALGLVVFLGSAPLAPLSPARCPVALSSGCGSAPYGSECPEGSGLAHDGSDEDCPSTDPCGPECACTCCPGPSTIASMPHPFAPGLPPADHIDAPADENLEPDGALDRIFRPPRA